MNKIKLIENTLKKWNIKKKINLKTYKKNK